MKKSILRSGSGGVALVVDVGTAAAATAAATVVVVVADAALVTVMVVGAVIPGNMRINDID